MKNLIFSLLALILLSSFNYSNSSSEKKTDSKHDFKKVLLVNYHNFGTYGFSSKMIEELQTKYLEKGKKSDFLPIFVDQDEYRVPFTKEELMEIEGRGNAEIDNMVLKENFDLILVFMPTYTEESPASGEGSSTRLQEIKYTVKAIDAATKDEIWTTEFNVKSMIDLELKNKKIAKMLFIQLEENDLAFHESSSVNKAV